MHVRIITLLGWVVILSCTSIRYSEQDAFLPVLKPDWITDTTRVDTDDPAIWIHPTDPSQSLILGTDKGDANGGIYVFDIRGKMIREKCILDQPRPNNVDVEYGLSYMGSRIDIAVYTLRNRDLIRIVRLPEMTFIDGGGIPVFEGEQDKGPMGVALYKHPTTGEIDAIISRKFGPDGQYLWQYRLTDQLGTVKAELRRKFGAFKGKKEIEAIAVDDELGYVYYSDEGCCVRKYHADPEKGDAELASFGYKEFKEDHEGISIYPTGAGTGYILVSDQQANRFNIYPREGAPGQPHLHQRIVSAPFSTNESDGSEVTAVPILPLYPKGFFIAMSDNRTFQLYRWEAIEALIRQRIAP